MILNRLITNIIKFLVMNKKSAFLAIIPARGGSKRLPGKNKVPIAGQPMICWTIDACLGSQFNAEILVSTDDAGIAAIAKEKSISVPFVRPEVLASDSASSVDVVKHAIDFYKHEFNREFEYVVLLQPTSPLRTSADIDGAIQLLESKNADAVVSVCLTEHSPLWSNTLPSDLSMVNFISNELKDIRSQELDNYYRLNGAIYIAKTTALLEEESFFLKNNTYAYVMDRENSIDVDELIDFRIAECLLHERLI